MKFFEKTLTDSMENIIIKGYIFYDKNVRGRLNNMKKLILVVSPPACGKTFISKKKELLY